MVGLKHRENRGQTPKKPGSDPVGVRGLTLPTTA